MVSRPFHCIAPRNVRFARTLLLWLALVLALGQVVAIRHAYTHAPGEGTSQTGKHSAALAHCDACIAALALGGAAPPPPAPLLFAEPTAQRPGLPSPSKPALTRQQRPYAIRAPPAISS